MWEINFRWATKHLAVTCQDEDKMGYFVAKVPAKWHWQWFFPFLIRRPVPLPVVTTVSGLIKAGDEGVFTCSMFDSVANKTSEVAVSWKPIYEAFLRECVWAVQQQCLKGFTSFRNPLTANAQSKYMDRYKESAEFAVWRIKREAEGKRNNKASPSEPLSSDAITLIYI